ncbi:MAG: phosphotransferase family protein [Halobaculum sp.]
MLGSSGTGGVRDDAERRAGVGRDERGMTRVEWAAVSVDRAARAAFPDRAVTDTTLCSTRPGNATGLVTFADGESVYVKTARDATRLAREAAATRAAPRPTTPTVVASDATSDPPVLATRPARGVPFTDRWSDDRRGAVRAAGRALARLHETRFDTPGIVCADGTDLRIETAPWPETLAATLRARADDWLPDRFADCADRLPRLVRRTRPTVGDTAPRLCHDDVTRSNVRVDPPGLIDLERALVGDPALDLVCARTHLIEQPDVPPADRDRLVDALHAGYRAIAGDLPATLPRNRPLYRATSYLLVLQAFDSLRELVGRPAGELEREVREEFDRRCARALAATDE